MILKQLVAYTCTWRAKQYQCVGVFILYIITISNTRWQHNTGSIKPTFRLQTTYSSARPNVSIERSQGLHGRRNGGGGDLPFQYFA